MDGFRTWLEGVQINFHDQFDNIQQSLKDGTANNAVDKFYNLVDIKFTDEDTPQDLLRGDPEPFKIDGDEISISGSLRYNPQSNTPIVTDLYDKKMADTRRRQLAAREKGRLEKCRSEIDDQIQILQQLLDKIKEEESRPEDQKPKPGLIKTAPSQNPYTGFFHVPGPVMQRLRSENLRFKKRINPFNKKEYNLPTAQIAGEDMFKSKIKETLEGLKDAKNYVFKSNLEITEPEESEYKINKTVGEKMKNFVGYLVARKLKDDENRGPQEEQTIEFTLQKFLQTHDKPIDVILYPISHSELNTIMARRIKQSTPNAELIALEKLQGLGALKKILIEEIELYRHTLRLLGIEKFSELDFKGEEVERLQRTMAILDINTLEKLKEQSRELLELAPTMELAPDPRFGSLYNGSRYLKLQEDVLEQVNEIFFLDALDELLGKYSIEELGNLNQMIEKIPEDGSMRISAIRYDRYRPTMRVFKFNKQYLQEKIGNKHILIIDDNIDTGGTFQTLHKLVNFLEVPPKTFSYFSPIIIDGKHTHKVQKDLDQLL